MTLYVLQVFRRSNGGPAGTWSCQTFLSPKDVLVKSSSLYWSRPCYARKLPECNFYNEVTTCDPPKKQNFKMSIHLSKAILVFSALTEEAFMAYVRREKSFSETTLVHGTVEEAGSIRSTSRFPSGPDRLDLHPASGTVYSKAVKVIWVSHRVIKTQ